MMVYYQKTDLNILSDKYLYCLLRFLKEDAQEDEIYIF